jgi:succinate dehydrogenase / fumarate reductase flavoprotein subunit
MQGLADGYFILPYTIGNYLANNSRILDEKHEMYAKTKKTCDEQIKKLLSISGTKTVDEIHKELGKVMWNNVGMSRTKADLEKTLQLIPKIKKDFWNNVKIPGTDKEFNPELEKAGRLADFIELGELMARDALHREESCGGHFREEYQTKDNEALRKDDQFSYVAAWEYKQEQHIMYQEELNFENVKLATRSYK